MQLHCDAESAVLHPERSDIKTSYSNDHAFHDITTNSVEYSHVAALLTWCVNNGKVWTELVLDFDNNFFCPKLLLSFQASVLIFYVVLQKMLMVLCLTAVRTVNTFNETQVRQTATSRYAVETL